MFVKLFGTPEHGQILIQKADDDEGDPTIKVTVQHGDVTASIAFGYEGDNQTERRDDAFDNVDQEFAEKVADTLLGMIKESI